MDSTILLFIIKLVVGGLVSFFAILLMSKTRDSAWMFIVSGLLISYAYLIYDMLCDLGVLPALKLSIKKIPLIPLIGFLLPALCFIIAFIIKLSRR